MKRSRFLISKEEGFTFALCAAMLVVASMIAATILQQSRRDIFWNPRIETQQKLKVIATALVAYQREHQRLPCVAPRMVADSAANHGKAQVTCHGISAKEVGTERVISGARIMRLGAVPYKDLKIMPYYAVDEWGNHILYAVDEKLTNMAQFMAPASAGVLTVQGQSGTSLTTEAAFVLVSHGKDGKGGINFISGNEGIACSAIAGSDQENCDNDLIFRAKAIHVHEAGAERYDDHIYWQLIHENSKILN